MAISNSGYQKGTTAAPQGLGKVIGTQPAPLSGFPAYAAYTTALAGANNDVVFTAKNAGVEGNNVTIRYVVAGTNTPLSVSVTGTAITVNVATDGGGAATSTSSQVQAAIAASAPANALVSVANAGADTGAGVVAALSVQSLAGGSTIAGPVYTGPSAKAIGAGIPIHYTYGQRG